MEIQQLEILCKQLYEATDASIRAEAEKALVTFVNSPDALPKCQLLLDRADSSYAQMLAASTLTKLIQGLTLEQRIDIRSYALNYMATRPNLQHFVIQALVTLLAKTTKYGWFDSYKGELVFQNLLEDVKKFLQGSVEHCTIGVQILSQLVSEMNSIVELDVHLSFSKNRKIATSYRNQQLYDTFLLSCSLLITARDNNKNLLMDEPQQALISHVLRLTKNCLSFDFIGSSTDESADDMNNVQIPTAWRPAFLDPNTLKLFFDLYQILPNGLASYSLSCLVQMTSVRRSLFSNSERTKFLTHLVEGVKNILTNLHGLSDPDNYHEFCRLLARLKSNYQLGELIAVPCYPEAIELIAKFTVQSLHMWLFAPNSVHYLLTLWQRMVASVPYVKSPDPHLLGTYTPEVIKAYIESRLDAVPVIVRDNLEDPLDDLCMVQQQLEQLSVIERCEYNKTCNLLVQHFDQKAREYENLVQNPNANSIDITVHELQLTWLVYIIGSAIVGRLSVTTSDEHDTMDAELVIRVLQLMSLTDARLPQAGCEKLELAVLSFLDQVRKMHSSEQAQKANVYKRLSEVFGLSDEQMLLSFINRKIITNLKFWGRSEQIITKTLMLLSDLSVHFNSVRKLARLEEVQFMLTHHTSDHFPFLGTNSSLSEMRCRTMFYTSLGRLLMFDLGEDEERFYNFLTPLTNQFESLGSVLMDTNSFPNDEAKKAIIGLSRDLRGLALPLNARIQYTMLFEWLYYTDYLPILLRAVELWAHDPAVTTPVLKLFAELVHCRTQRLAGNVSSPMGILLFREASKLICIYGNRILHLEVPRDQLYPMRLKGIAICFLILKNSLGGNYVNCGVFKLYGDDTLDNVLKIIAKLILSIQQSDLLEYPKLSSAYYNLLNCLSQDHVTYLAALEPCAFVYILESLTKGLAALDSAIYISCCTILDSIVSYIFKQLQLKVSTFPNKKLRSLTNENAQFLKIVEMNSELLQTMMSCLLNNVLAEDCRNQWSMSRPLLVLILLYEDYYRSLKESIIRGQPVEKQQTMAQWFDDLMLGIERNVSSKNKEKFTQNLLTFRRDVVNLPKTTTYVSQDPEDFYRLDPKRSAAENAHDIYAMLCLEETRDTKRLFLLNALASLCLAASTGSPHNNLRFSTEELLYCLSASLVHTFTQVRAAALRTIRYALSTPKDIKVFNTLQLHHLLCRSIDLMLKNDDERVQALKLVRKMLAIAPDEISPVVVRCLVSLADSGIEESDNLLRACLATLAEFAVLNPALLIVCGGVTSITRNVLECHNPRIAESLCGVLLYLLEWPQTRNICGVRLDCLAAPYCDFTYRLGIMDKNKDARELRYTSCRLALLSVLRSWTGTLEFCDPSKPSGLKAIVDALYLNQVEVRKAILDLLYELLSIPQPTWTDDYSVALQAVDPADFQDSWLLTNGFVSAEGRSILPSLAARAPNVVEQHLALLLYCFLETGLLNALVEVAASPDQFVSVRATILIGKILQLMHTHLPADICSTSPALPTLIGHASQGNQQANAAVAALQNYQKMLRERPASCSLFLDSIIQGGALIQTRLFRRHLNVQEQPMLSSLQMLDTAAAVASTIGGTLGRPPERTRLDSVSSSDESNSQASNSLRSSFRLKRKLLPQVFCDNFRAFNRLLTDSHVLTQSDPNAWDWDVITTILRSNQIRKLDYTLGKFLKRLVDFYKPSNNRFSHQDLVPGQNMPAYVSAGLDLIDVLLANNELECMRYITDYFSDISQHLLAVTTSNRAHDCLFSPQHMNNTMCQQYFLYIGRMCRSSKGIEVLKNTTVFEYLITLVRLTDHVCYVKLIVSGLNYSYEKWPRQVLEKALTLAKTRSGRLYATQFLAVLLRARLPNFEVWGLPLIIQQTKDADRSVTLAAMDVLEEACHDKYYLEEIVSLWPQLKQLGDVGRLLMSRYYSLSRGLNSTKARIEEEIKFWKNGYNKRYVLLVEADTHASLTLHIRNEDGYYSRRNCNQRPQTVPPNIPPHLYGQMAQTTQGMTALRNHADLPQLLELLTRGKCSDEAECLELKSAIWALCHASTHANGIEYFVELNCRLYEKLIVLVTKCEVYSVRATCFSALGLVAGTQEGANILFKLNWLSIRHDRNTIWPVHQPEDWMGNQLTPVRHHYEDMPPYNYAGIDDQIDGSYYTGSYWNLLLSGSGNTTIPDANVGMTGAATTIDEVYPQHLRTLSSGVAAKSKTLPEGSNLRQGKHQRSLSESKTTDVISLLGGPVAGASSGMGQGPVPYQHRIRYNSCTDSNTSGVSSCESVTGRTAAAAAAVACDFQQFPLSPIPSLSNLVEMQQPMSSQVRHTSLLGTSYLNRAISPMAMKGYAQLRNLRAPSRPVFSESAAELYDLIDIVDRADVGRTRKYSWGESQRRSVKVRSFDRQTMFNVFSRLSTEELQVPLPTLNAPKFLPPNDLQGPCYAGICLPKNALDLFPTRNLNRTYISRDIQDQDVMGMGIHFLSSGRQQVLNDSLNNEGGDESSVISSLSDVSSSASRRQLPKWQHQGGKHARSQCIHCTRSSRHQLRQEAQSLTLSHSNGVMTLAPAPCELYSNAAAALVAAGMQAGPALASGSAKKSGSSGSMHLGPDISFHSPESMLSEDSLPDRLTGSILYNIQRLANPVSAKQSKMALLELKQKHPHAFQDICLYSESCKTLGRGNYRMSARRFLQELFLDLNFDAFYVEPQLIIRARKLPTEEKAEISTISSTAASPPAILLTHKTQLKAKPTAQLASVYETSWENLLMEQSPRLGTTKVPSKTILAPTNELHISDTKSRESKPDKIEAQDPGEDVCDSAEKKNVDDTKNQSSIEKEENVNPNPQTNLENDNRQYTRGRFYTLELDLSCSKNKFPIRDRNRIACSTANTAATVATPVAPTIFQRQVSADATTPTVANEASLHYSNVTKSLSASMAKPVGRLYCEKRLQGSKSEAVLGRDAAAICSGSNEVYTAGGNGRISWNTKLSTS